MDERTGVQDLNAISSAVDDYLPVCLCLSGCLPACLSVCLSVCPPACSFIHSSSPTIFYPSSLSFVCPSAHVCMFVSLSVCLFACLSVCLSVRVFTGCVGVVGDMKRNARRVAAGGRLRCAIRWHQE